MSEITCPACQGIGTTGGSFPGMMGRHIPGETCWQCNGSGRISKPIPRDLPPIPKIDATGTSFTDVVRKVEENMPNPFGRGALPLFDAARTKEILSRHPEARKRPDTVKMPLSSSQRMQDVLDYAYLLDNAKRGAKTFPNQIATEVVDFWQAHYDRVVLFYTDPMSAKRYA